MRQQIGLFLGIPLLLLLLSLSPPAGMAGNAYSVACVTIFMGFLWVTEAIPISATALIPLVAFPLLRIQGAGETSASYGSSHIFLFMGGFIIAKAMEKWNLHKRMALEIIHFIGTGKRRIILGFMIASAFLSMWISNTATTLMMYPIGLAVVQSLIEFDSSDGSSNERTAGDFSTAVMLSIAFSASIGGIATLIGTPPNLVFVATANTLFPNSPQISFAQWFLMGFPIVCIFIPLAWWYMVTFGFPFPKERRTSYRTPIANKLMEMGKITREEKLVAGVFFLTAVGWIFRRDLNLGFFTVPGWSDLLNLNDYVHDATVAIGSALLLFLMPTNLRTGERLITWEDAKEIPWGILILFGGGIAIADGFRSTELSVWIANSLTIFSFLPPLVLLIIVCIVMTVMTEFTSNVSTAAIFMPILAGLATAAGIHPYILMIPATITVSCAFFLPVATPPNAIIFGSGKVKITDMMRIGIVFDIIGLILIISILYFIIFPLIGIHPSNPLPTM